MNGKKSVFGVFSVAMGLSLAVLAGCQGNEPQADARIQMQPATADVKGTMTEITEPSSPGFNMEQMSVLLDGTIHSMASLSGIQDQLSIIVDDKTGMARAYRTTEEFDSYVKEQAKDCTSSGVSAMDTTSACVFYDSLSCGAAWTRRIVAGCGTAVGGVTSIMTVRSMALGCGLTFVCPTTDCSGNCMAAWGPAGSCYNITSGTVGCVGCMN